MYHSFWTLWEGGGMIWENGIKTCIISYKKRIPSPGSMQDTGSLGWCTGMTQRDGMGREVGGGFRLGNTCKPVADACWCMAKPIQHCKVKKKKIMHKSKTFGVKWKRSLIMLIALWQFQMWSHICWHFCRRKGGVYVRFSWIWMGFVTLQPLKSSGKYSPWDFWG